MAGGCALGGTAPRRTDQSNTLYIGESVQAFPTSFLPWQSRDGVDPTIAGLLYDSLSPYNEMTGKYDIGLAKEWYFVDENDNPIVNEHGEIDYDKLEEVYDTPDKTFIRVKFILHENATWSDGHPLTVEDVYFSFDLAANYELSQHAGALVWVNDIQHTYVSGKLARQGIFTYDRGAADAGYNIPESQKDTVIYFHINKVLGAVAPMTSTLLPLPRHIIEPLISKESPLINRDPTAAQTEAFANPVGSGPYKLDRANTNSQQITLTRRDDYHTKADNGGLLYGVETLKFLLYQDVNVALYALKKGHIDILDTSISADYVNLFEDDDNVKVMRAPTTFVDTLVLNLNAPNDKMTPMRSLLTNVDVRRAIALAIDQNDLVEKVLNSTGSPYSQGLIGKQQPFFDPDLKLHQGGLPEEIDLANSLLDKIIPQKDEQGYRMYEGKRVSFEILGHPGEQTTIAFLQVQLQKIGIEVNFKPKGSNPENTYLYSGDFDMTLHKVSLTESNIDTMLNSHFVNLNKSSNYGRYIDPEFEELSVKMRTTLNKNYKSEIAFDVQEKIANMYYKLPLFSGDILSVYRDDRFTGQVMAQGATALNDSSLRNMTQVEGGK